jgi:uncharacterized membrane protein YhhN
MDRLLPMPGDGLDALRLVIVGASLAAGLAYFGIMRGPVSVLRTVAKTMAIAVLALLPLTYLGAFPQQVPGLLLLALALGLSALGDMFLALGEARRPFVAGLASFLLAHVVYVVGFLPFVDVPSPAAVAAMAACGGAALVLVLRLWPRLGGLRLPVLAYFVVIMTMVAGSLSVPSAGLALSLGAVIFAVSDSLIAVRKFLAPFRFVNDLVWLTYVVAQFLITGAMLQLLLGAG